MPPHLGTLLADAEERVISVLRDLDIRVRRVVDLPRNVAFGFQTYGSLRLFLLHIILQRIREIQ